MWQIELQEIHMKRSYEMFKEYFAVIDIETNWNQEMMSIGMVIADNERFAAIDKTYFIISPQYKVGGKYSRALRDMDKKYIKEYARATAISNLTTTLQKYEVKSIFGYNVQFDYRYFPELHHYVWHDIMRVAANVNINANLPLEEDYYRTGLLKHRSFEHIMRLIYWKGYTESHNALCDAIDELQLMQIINQSLDVYCEYKPRSTLTSNKLTTNNQQKNELRHTKILTNLNYLLEKSTDGTIILTDIEKKKAVANRYDTQKYINYDYLLHLACVGCGHQWKQEIDSLFENIKCPNCTKN